MVAGSGAGDGEAEVLDSDGLGDADEEPVGNGDELELGDPEGAGVVAAGDGPERERVAGGTLRRGAPADGESGSVEAGVIGSAFPAGGRTTPEPVLRALRWVERRAATGLTCSVGACTPAHPKM